jgi:DNA-binding transcriptional MerR regulator
MASRCTIFGGILCGGTKCQGILCVWHMPVDCPIVAFAMETPKSQKLYTTSEVAKAAGVPLATLQSWITTGVIPAPPVQPGRGAGVRLWTYPQMRQIRKMRKLRESPAFLKNRSERQAAALKKTLATEEARARMSATATKALADPGVRARRGAAIKKALAIPGVRARMSVGIKRAWTPERRQAQAAATARIMADPEMNKRRLAGLRRANADPELNAHRIANLKKATADPAVRRRKIKKMKETLHTPELNARRSARLTKMWADFRDGSAALAKSAKPSKGPGAPPKHERHKRAAELFRSGLTWRAVAEVVDRVNFAKDPEATAHTVRVNTKRWMKSHPQVGDSLDEPKALHDDRSSEGRGRAPGDAAQLGQNQEDLGPAHSAPSEQGGEALDGRAEKPDSDTAR